MQGKPTQVTELLQRWSQGDTAAREDVIPLVYSELRRIARYSLAGWQSGNTLQSTALVHEAYLRLVDRTSVHWDNRVHFFAVAAQLMRRILVDHVRRINAQKRGGQCLTLVLDEGLAVPGNQREVDLLALDDAMESLAQVDPRQSRMVELRFFGGLSIEETAQVLEVSPATVKRDWIVAKTWLYRQLARNVKNES